MGNFYFLHPKRVQRLGLTGLALCVAVWAMAQDTATGLKLHYTFDATTGAVVADDSGNNNTGALNGAAAVTTGYSGQGVACTNKADYIAAPANITVGVTSFTFATWVKLSALKNSSRFFDWGTGADGTNNFLAFIPSYNADDGYMVLRYRPVSGLAINVTSTTKCPVGSWAHVAVTFDWNATAGTATATIYLNGEPVGSASGLPFNPDASLGNTANNYFGYSRWAQDANGFNGIFDDIRVYNRALSKTDLLALAGLGDLYQQRDNLSLGDISALTGSLTLPTTLGTQGVTATWTSSNTALISASGTVTRPTKYDKYVKLTALLSMTLNGIVYTTEKSFVACVKGTTTLPEHICQWTFDPTSIVQSGTTIQVKDKMANSFLGTVKNEARIRTIGNTVQYNVLDLEDGTGYFNMGVPVGEAIYSLTNYSVTGYFRIDNDYADLAATGNYLYAFANSTTAETSQNGFMCGKLNNTAQLVTKSYATSGQSELAVGTPAPKGAWHHYAYVQNGNTGRIYIDGVLAKEGEMARIPAIDLAIQGRAGTFYNYLGRSINNATEAYLRRTLIYDFNVYSKALSESDLTSTLAVPTTLASLNSAFAENPDFKQLPLQYEYDHLLTGDLSQVTSNLEMPTKGTTYGDVAIAWTTTKADIVSTAGVVNQPSYFDYKVTLTATLTYGIQTMVKTFDVNVLAKNKDYFTSDLLVKFDFSNLNGTTVKDVAEKQFAGTLVNNATVRTIGTQATGIYNVMDLGSSNGYFDMGAEVGKVLCRLNDYTVGAFFRVDDAYAGLSSAGNFLWCFSNSVSAASNQNGYIMSSLADLTASITPSYYTAASGNQSVSLSAPALAGNWHHLAYTQKGNVGTLYLDGMPVATSTITNLPTTALIKDGIMGTPYNWIGRSCYSTDAYLRQTMVYDLRLYNKALSISDIQKTRMNVAETLVDLEKAYKANVATGKTDDTQFAETTLHGTPSLLEITKTDHTQSQVELSNLKKMTFADTYMNLNLKNGSIDNYAIALVGKMMFTGNATSVNPTATSPTWGLYPNPSADCIWFSNLSNADLRVAIYAISGRLVLEQRLASPTEKVDVTSLPRGVYVVKIGSQAVKFSKK